MGIGLGIDYVTWWEILKWISPTSKLHVGHKIKFQSYGYRVRNCLCHMVGNPKMDPPHIKTLCGTQKKNSNPMGIGLGIDYVTWWEILKLIPPTSKLHVGHKRKFQSYGYRVRN